MPSTQPWISQCVFPTQNTAVKKWGVRCVLNMREMYMFSEVEPHLYTGKGTVTHYLTSIGFKSLWQNTGDYCGTNQIHFCFLSNTMYCQKQRFVTSKICSRFFKSPS